MKRIAVLTSGGDAPGMNAAIRAVAKTGASLGLEVLGVELGYEGLMVGRFTPLTRPLGDGLATVPTLESAGGFGGTLLGSARSMRFMQPEGRAAAAEHLREADVEGLVVIGGNGSLTGALALMTETSVPIVGIPASIDNDLGATSTAIGVDTALNTILEACDRISDTARAHRRAFVVEVMGRHCGYLAMVTAAAASADAVLFPESRDPDEDVVPAVESAIRRVFTTDAVARRALVIKAEGVGISTEALVSQLQERLGDLQGVDVRGVVLGHVVRGGAPSVQDRMVAARFGFAAVHALVAGTAGVMTSWRPHSPPPGALPTLDPAVLLVPLTTMLAETAELLDGSSDVTRRRVRMMQALEGVATL